MQCDDDLSPKNSTLSLSLLELPIEILLHICSFLDAATLVHRLSLVCKDLNILLNDDLLWKARINQLCPKSSFPVLPPAEDDELFWKLSCVAIEREYQIWENYDGDKMERLSLANVHYGTIDSVLLMNNAKICVSGARDRSLVYWAFPSDENDGSLSKVTSDAHEGWIWDLTALHDTVYSCSWDRTVKAWKLTEGGLVHSTTYQMDVSGALLCVTSSQDIGLFAAGSFCKTVLIFDPRSEQSLISKFQPHHRAVVRIAMNSNYIISASEDKTVSIWDQRARKTLKNIKVFKESFPMSISMQKGIVYVGDNGGRVHVLDPSKDFELVQTYVTGHKKAITGVHGAPGCLITSSLDKTVRISSPTHPPRLIRTLQSTYGEVASMDYSNEVLAISGTDGIEIWRPKNTA